MILYVCFFRAGDAAAALLDAADERKPERRGENRGGFPPRDAPEERSQDGRGKE